MKFNQQLIKRAIEPESPVILAVDCSFIPKSGKQTYGIDYFYNGSVSRAEKGLEVSAMAVVDVNHKTAYNLSVQQTPASSSSLEKIESAQNTRIDCYLEQLKATFPYLPSSLRYVVSDGFYSNSSSGCSYAVLFCTDLKLNPYSIYLYYKARFQIEFIFRDSKQFTGLADCQARDLTKLDFHFNSSLTALNLAKLDAVEQHDSDSKLLKPL
jgi:hypothetical protein